MSSKMMVNIPSSDRTDGGAVRIDGEVGRFRLQCTVAGCGWTSKPRNYATAQRIAFDHGAWHQFG